MPGSQSSGSGWHHIVFFSWYLCLAKIGVAVPSKEDIQSRRRVCSKLSIHRNLSPLLAIWNTWSMATWVHCTQLVQYWSVCSRDWSDFRTTPPRSLLEFRVDPGPRRPWWRWCCGCRGLLPSGAAPGRSWRPKTSSTWHACFGTKFSPVTRQMTTHEDWKYKMEVPSYEYGVHHWMSRNV